MRFARSGTEADGELTYGEAFAVQPFGNSLVIMTLTGAQIDALLEQQFDDSDTGYGNILQVSAGFSYTWDAAAPVGSRVNTSSIAIDGAAIEPDGTLPGRGQQLPGGRRQRLQRSGGGQREDRGRD